MFPFEQRTIAHGHTPFINESQPYGARVPSGSSHAIATDMRNNSQYFQSPIKGIYGEVRAAANTKGHRATFQNSCSSNYQNIEPYNVRHCDELNRLSKNCASYSSEYIASRYNGAIDNPQTINCFGYRSANSACSIDEGNCPAFNNDQSRRILQRGSQWTHETSSSSDTDNSQTTFGDRKYITKPSFVKRFGEWRSVPALRVESNENRQVFHCNSHSRPETHEKIGENWLFNESVDNAGLRGNQKGINDHSTEKGNQYQNVPSSNQTWDYRVTSPEGANMKSLNAPYVNVSPVSLTTGFLNLPTDSYADNHQINADPTDEGNYVDMSGIKIHRDLNSNFTSLRGISESHSNPKKIVEGLGTSRNVNYINTSPKCLSSQFDTREMAKNDCESKRHQNYENVYPYRALESCVGGRKETGNNENVTDGAHKPERADSLNLFLSSTLPTCNSDYINLTASNVDTQPESRSDVSQNYETGRFSNFFDPSRTVQPLSRIPPSYTEALGRNNRHDCMGNLQSDVKSLDKNWIGSPSPVGENLRRVTATESVSKNTVDAEVYAVNANYKNNVLFENCGKPGDITKRPDVDGSDYRKHGDAVSRDYLTDNPQLKIQHNFILVDADTVGNHDISVEPVSCIPSSTSEGDTSIMHCSNDSGRTNDNISPEERHTDSGIEHRESHGTLDASLSKHVDEALSEFSRFGSDRSHASSSSPSYDKRRSRIHRSPFSALPDDVVIHILSFLKTNMLCRCTRVCRRWLHLVWDASLWTAIRITDERVNVDSGLRAVTKQLSFDTPSVCLALQRVSLTGCVRLTDRGLRTLAKLCPEIQTLDLRGCRRITGEGISLILSSCVNVVKLDITGCRRVTRLSPDMLRQKSLRHQLLLTYVDLSECTSVTDDVTRELTSACTRLRYLYLRRCVLLTDKSLAAVSKHCSDLLELSISDCNLVTDVGMVLLRTLSQLRYISVAKCEKVSDVGMKAVAQSCKNFRYVNIRGCHSISDDTVVSLAENSSSLRSLDVGNCDVTDESLVAIGEHCHQLRKLSVKFCDTVTDDGIVAIATKCPRLQQLNIHGCHVTSIGYRAVKQNCPHCLIEHSNPGFA